MSPAFRPASSSSRLEPPSGTNENVAPQQQQTQSPRQPSRVPSSGVAYPLPSSLAECTACGHVVKCAAHPHFLPCHARVPCRTHTLAAVSSRLCICGTALPDMSARERMTHRASPDSTPHAHHPLRAPAVASTTAQTAPMCRASISAPNVAPTSILAPTRAHLTRWTPSSGPTTLRTRTRRTPWHTSCHSLRAARCRRDGSGGAGGAGSQRPPPPQWGHAHVV